MIEIKSWWVSQVQARAVLFDRLGAELHVLSPPRALKIIYIQSNLLSTDDEDVILQEGKDLWSFYSDSFFKKKIKMALRFTLDSSAGSPWSMLMRPKRIICNVLFIRSHIHPKTSVGQLVSFHNVSEKVETQKSGERSWIYISWWGHMEMSRREVLQWVTGSLKVSECNQGECVCSDSWIFQNGIICNDEDHKEMIKQILILNLLRRLQPCCWMSDVSAPVKEIYTGFKTHLRDAPYAAAAVLFLGLKYIKKWYRHGWVDMILFQTRLLSSV